ncbi:ABC transporter substrate-binding protein [Flavimaricola marinus]|uniref:NMT1/THI5 like protein n=1 Tax=Flavimaricola marinus TaxID=1819565 RepID=A0A238LEQ0_9RHOB|nr:ABC transporter substrate-binding protein [Flavimaricola marinus]SMY08033.1 NMT1/THI5 like protein [Flavimaricola marinus]
MKMFKAMMLSTALAVTAAPSVSFAQETVNMINPLPRSMVFYPLVVGEALGYFEANGVEVNLLPSDTSIPYVAFLQNGQADLAMLDPNETINALNAGANINTVYEVMQNAPEGVVVLSDGEFGAMGDLVGTTVGLVSDRDRAFLQAALDIAGHSIDDVDTVVLGENGPTLAAAIRGGNVSALVGSVNDWASLQAAGIGLTAITPDELKASPANTFAMDAAMVEEKREALEGFMRAWSMGMYASIVNPEAVEAIMRANVPEEWEDELAGKTLFDIVLTMNIGSTERYGDLQRDVWAEIQPRMLSSGAIEQTVDVDTFLNDAYIEAANDFDKAQVEADAAAWLAENM